MSGRLDLSAVRASLSACAAGFARSGCRIFGAASLAGGFPGTGAAFCGCAGRTAFAPPAAPRVRTNSLRSNRRCGIAFLTSCARATNLCSCLPGLKKAGTEPNSRGEAFPEAEWNTALFFGTSTMPCFVSMKALPSFTLS
jgi:hypothetical protein